MGLGDAAAGGKPQAGAGPVALAAQAHQRFQDPGPVVRVDALSIIGHEDGGAVVIGDTADPDL